jgi:hypothetical protein
LSDVPPLPLLQAEVSRRLTGWVFDFWGNPYRSQVQYMEVRY